MLFIMILIFPSQKVYYGFSKGYVKTEGKKMNTLKCLFNKALFNW